MIDCEAQQLVATHANDHLQLGPRPMLQTAHTMATLQDRNHALVRFVPPPNWSSGPPTEHVLFLLLNSGFSCALQSNTIPTVNIGGPTARSHQVGHGSKIVHASILVHWPSPTLEQVLLSLARSPNVTWPVRPWGWQNNLQSLMHFFKAINLVPWTKSWISLRPCTHCSVHL